MVSAPTRPPVKPPRVASGENRVALRGLTWAQYQQILDALPQTRASRLTYSLGTLEITMPLEDHEQASEFIAAFIKIVARGLNLKWKTMGSTTLDREDLNRGSEPDKAFYIQKWGKVAGHSVDLKRDPPADLVVAVDITHTDIDKNRLYAAMGVPELWRFDGHFLRIYVLENNAYLEVEQSPVFPVVEKQALYNFLDHAKQDESEAEDRLRDWIQQRVQN
ncbi:Uma2 family endonuclease [cf. Phormidesmis sp. LEGE 11477]|uniref:Uma2 family endonuclease n=1 Tax=cf. Phormidesmis sp. LEGE 11477 TaxID=1828680 RepID=UPI00187F604E|nr:Uma2 family endonuclease [cf. Phormidesmis sp. LEGE 11477]MBE9062731.1 Uma2 family endonuclease [cf. Phormidesmis sp. LEGE 11477]